MSRHFMREAEMQELVTQAKLASAQAQMLEMKLSIGDREPSAEARKLIADLVHTVTMLQRDIQYYRD